MLRKHSRQEMAKASLWMHKKEFDKLAELSGDMSLNVYLMQIIRKSLANELSKVPVTENENKNKKDGVKGSKTSNLASHPDTPS